jgi:hypothetical protein
MNNILIPVNKNVTPELRYYSVFLNKIADYIAGTNTNVYFVLFSKLLIVQFEVHSIITGEESNTNNKSINELENEYQFSFKEILYTDLLQSCNFINKTRERNWYIPDNEFIENDSYSNKLNQIITLINEKDITHVVTDQSVDYEQCFIEKVCKIKNIPFVRYLPNFMNRAFFTLYENKYNGKIIDISTDAVDENNIISFINEYRNGDSSSIYMPNEDNLKQYQPKIERTRKRIFHKNFNDYISYTEIILRDFYINNIERHLKHKYYTKIQPNEKYIYYGLHLTTESHVALHSFPFLNQVNVIETISRALPFGYSLYVKPHPWWSHKISLGSLKQISNFPSVKLLSPDISIKKIIKKSRGVVTLNATTGIEALVLGKPVVALSQVNSYTEMHPNATRCIDLYELPSMLVNMVNSRVNIQDTDNYMLKMFKLSSNIRFEADRFLSDDDATKKALLFSKYILKVINKISRASQGNN